MLLLLGPLGAGKTTLVRYLLAKWGHAGPVPSPSFDLVHRYRLADRTVYHVDLYRVSDPRELEALDLPAGGGRFVILAEWGQALRDWYPDRFELDLAFGAGPGTRRARLSAFGAGRVRLSAWLGAARP